MLNREAMRAQAWGPALPDAVAQPALLREWKAWTGDRGLRIGALRVARDAADIAPAITLTAALIAALTGGVEFLRTDPKLIPLAQAALNLPAGASFSTHTATSLLVAAWAANPAMLPQQTARAAQFGAHIAILNISDGGRTGHVVYLPPFALFPPLPLPDTPPSLTPLCILLAATDQHFVPLLRLPEWAITPKGQTLYTSLRGTLAGQSRQSADPTACVLGIADCVARAT